MGKIRMLSDSMIGKIAAGEVVERPVSALKELIENSLDAGASAITAEIREGGLSYMRVTDNGTGIDESDLRLAFERHATSKVFREPDLNAIATLGFRGEALASIAAVSHIVMTTRTKDRETGLRVTNEGGKILKIEETACTIGTSIIVTDLFFNTPVRKGFMKKASTEAAAIHEVMAQFIISRPDVSFRFLNDGKTCLHSPGDGHLASAAMTVFGAKAMKEMRKVDGHKNGILLKGYVGIGDSARGNRGQEYFFINGRMMHSSILSAALETACRERVMIGKFPVCALHLKIAYENVDVNVHPNKLEVRFRDEQAVHSAVIDIVMDALKENDPFHQPPELQVNQDSDHRNPEKPTRMSLQEGLKKSNASVTVIKQIPSVRSSEITSAAPSEEVGLYADRTFKTISDTALRENTFEVRPFTRPDTSSDTANSVIADVQAPDTIQTETRADIQQNNQTVCAEQVNSILPYIQKDMRIFGALFNTFILIEYEDRLLMVDQHAVHERLLFDRMMKEHSIQQTGQELLIPLIISVSSKELLLIEENHELFESIGLVIERFGEHDAAIRTIPMVLGEAEGVPFVRDVLSDLEKSNSLSFEKKRSDILQTACKHAVKGGEPLTEDQLRELIDGMLSKHVTPTCPHGRPLVISLSHREIDKKFKRIQD